MFLTQLRYFREVARLGSIRKASDRLNVSPSSVSRQILVLERQFGAALLERSANGVRLSDAGKHVDDFARTTLLNYDTLRADIDDFRGVSRAIVRIAAIDSVINWPVLAVVQRFRVTFPNVTFRLLSLTASGVAQSVKSGNCDIGISINLGPDPDLNVLAEFEEPLMVAVALSHPLAQSPCVTLSELRFYDLAVHEADHGIRRMIDDASHALGFDFEPVLSSSSLHALKEFAKKGLGATILTRGGASSEIANGELILIPIDEPALQSGRLKLVARRDRRLSRVLRRFNEDLVATITQGPPQPE